MRSNGTLPHAEPSLNFRQPPPISPRAERRLSYQLFDILWPKWPRSIYAKMYRLSKCRPNHDGEKTGIKPGAPKRRSCVRA